ncbi:Gfo/Idh/MocA family protein [Pediococcus parvulus]|uniref:Gfo/Idh/MocA family protein n=1 Tax=Pediococcus parvulus TaxID=54062 RepID=UPI00345E190A
MKTINVGLIGIGTWAQYGVIPILNLLPQFRLLAIQSRSLNKAQNFAQDHKVPFYYDNEDKLLRNDKIDLIMVTTPAPTHFQYAKKAILAGKNVYTEWPLTTNKTQSQELVDLAKENHVRTFVGFQRRYSPSARFFKDLLDQKRIGKIRSARVSIGVEAFARIMPENYEWTTKSENYTDVLTVDVGHFADLLFHLVGQPNLVIGLTANQFKQTTLFDKKKRTKKVPYGLPNNVTVMGTLLESQQLFVINAEGAQDNISGMQLEVTGNDGVLMLTNTRAYQNEADNKLLLLDKNHDTFTRLTIPGKYDTLPKNDLDNSVQDAGYYYQAIAGDLMNDKHTTPSFETAVQMHEFISKIIDSNKKLREGE